MAQIRDSFDDVLENVQSLEDARAGAAAAKTGQEGVTGALGKVAGAMGAPGKAAQDVVAGVAKPAARGIALGAANTLRTGEWLARSIGLMAQDQPSVGEYLANKISASGEGQNLPQAFIQGASQFLTGLKGVKAGGAAVGLGGKGAVILKRAPTLVKDALTGAGASQVAFDPTEERLGTVAATGIADLAGADPKLMQMVKSYLLASKDDPESLARVKAFLGDALTGAVASPAVRGGTKLVGKYGKAFGNWLGDMLSYEREADRVLPAPSQPANPQLQSASREYQRMRSGPDMPTTGLDPSALSVAESRALQGDMNYGALKAELWDQYQHLADQGVEFQWQPSRGTGHPSMNELAPNGQTYATILDAVHQKLGYEATGWSDPTQAWATHGWMFSGDAVPAFTQEIRAGQMGKPIAGGAATVEEAAGPLAHKGGRPVPMPESKVAQQPQQGSGIADILSGLGERLQTMRPDEIEGEINKALGIGAQPETRIFEDTVFAGERKGSVMGPNDNMVVIQKGGKDAGYLWYTREPGGGFTTRKIEVLPEFRRQGLASQLEDKVASIEGPYKGSTDLTEEGKAFREGRKAKTQAGYRPEVEGILGVPQEGREAVQEAIAQRARERGLGPVDLQNILLAIGALKSKEIK